KKSIFRGTPSSKPSNPSFGRFGAGRLFSSNTLTSTFTKLTLTLIVPFGVCGSRTLSGACCGAGIIGPGAVGGCGGLLGGGGCGWVLDGCAHGGRSGFSCASARNAPANRASEVNHQIEIRGAWG